MAGEVMCAKQPYLTKHVACALVYEETYDSFWCAEHNQWAEDICGDADCNFCSIRPLKMEG